MTVCGGYFLTRAVERPAYVSSDLLPPRILSLSHCICDFVPDLWAIEWVDYSPADRAAEAEKWGIQAADLSQVIEWITEQIDAGEFGWPCVFFSPHDARSFAQRFLPRSEGVRLLGIGLPATDVEQFLATAAPGPSEGVPGIDQAISSRAGLEEVGTALGWEVLCYEYGSFCSWLCNHLERDVAEQFGIRPNETGFIATAGDAVRAAEYCGREEVGAEPGFWAPWLVVEYDLSSPSRPSPSTRATMATWTTRCP
jgi:hypothetical protein